MSHLGPVEPKQEQHSVETAVLQPIQALVVAAVSMESQLVEDLRLLEDMAEWKSYFDDVDWENVRNFGNILSQFEPDFFQQSILPLYCCHQHETYCGLSIYLSAIGAHIGFDRPCKDV